MAKMPLVLRLRRSVLFSMVLKSPPSSNNSKEVTTEDDVDAASVAEEVVKVRDPKPSLPTLLW
jgi:hypothetical protein